MTGDRGYHQALSTADGVALQPSLVDRVFFMYFFKGTEKVKFGEHQFYEEKRKCDR